MAEQSKNMEHKISGVLPGSIAEELGLEPGDVLLAVNGQMVEDIFDYQYLTNEEYLTALIRKPDGEEWELEIEKEFEEDLGIVFENSLMDEYRSCRNHCIFCFIDQMPPGMRDTLYFKDDDSRLSFLQGNYVTLTNMSDHDIDRIIRYHLEPINISFHTTNPALRCRMLNNRFAGEVFPKIRRLADAGIELNGQIVLCRGVNDESELDRSIREMQEYLPALKSVSVVPVGLTRYRENLCPLESFTKEDAGRVIDQIEGWQREIYPKWGLHFAHASDEWYLLAGRELPEAERYDGYLQLENGVGMLRLLMEEVRECLEVTRVRRGGGQEPECLAAREERNISRQAAQKEPNISCQAAQKEPKPGSQTWPDHSENVPDIPPEVPRRTVTIATGRLAGPYLAALGREITEVFPEVRLRVDEIRNDFFGESITVAGLITARDLISQLQGRPLGEELLLTEHMLRDGERVFLDDLTVEDVEKALQIKIRIVKSSGYDLVRAVTGRTF